MGQHDEFTLPSCSGGNLAGPIEFAERFCFANVVNAASSLRRGCSQRDGSRHIFNVAARRAKGATSSAKMICFLPSSIRFNTGWKRWTGSPGTIDHRQPQNCAGQFGVAEDRLFHGNLVILVVKPAVNGLRFL